MDPTMYSGSDAGALAAYMAFMATYSVIWLAFAIVMIVAYWRVFSKAGEAGWQSIIPIWNVIVLLKIAGRPWWWILLMLIPLVNIIIVFIVCLDIAKSFGHGTGFALGLFFLSAIFWLILAFGSSRYVGPGGVAAAPAPAYAAPRPAAAVPPAAPPPPAPTPTPAAAPPAPAAPAVEAAPAPAMEAPPAPPAAEPPVAPPAPPAPQPPAAPEE